MKVTLSQFAGFCNGVRRAYNKVINLDIKKLPQPVLVLGDLVHNQEVVKKIKAKKIDIISRRDFLTKKSKKIGTLIITAHGVGPEMFDLAKKRKINIIDTTCPNVIKVQRLAQVYVNRNYQVILVGDKKHKEVRGIFDWGRKKCLVVSNEDDLKKIKLNASQKAAVISQTTQESKKIKELYAKLKKANPQTKIILAGTICLATKNRQEEVKKLASRHDAVVVIGDKNSANSNRLFEIAKKINENSFFIQNKKQLKDVLKIKFQKVLVTAGASTPDWLIKEIVSEINKN